MENISLKSRIVDLQRYQTDVSKTFGILNNDLQVIDQHLKNNTQNQFYQPLNSFETFEAASSESPRTPVNSEEEFKTEVTPNEHLPPRVPLESKSEEDTLNQENVPSSTPEINLEHLINSLDRNLARLM
jgi:hypothetical protein